MKVKDNKIIVILFIFFGLFWIFFFIKNYKTNYEKLSPLSNYSDFFSCVKYSNDLIYNIAINNLTYLNNIFDSKFGESSQNLFLSNLNIDVNSYYKIESANYISIKDNYIYLLKGNIYNRRLDKDLVAFNDLIILIFLDYDNYSYSIYPFINNDYKDIINKVKKISIKRNDYNKINNVINVSEKDMSLYLYSDFYNSLNDIDYLYNHLSDSSKKEFKTKKDLEKFLSSNIDYISGSVDKFKLYKFDEYRKHIIFDKNGNHFSFYEKNITDYKIDLNSN